MSGTFSQIYIQLVFAVRNRNSVIDYEWEDLLYKYIGGILLNQKQKPIAINGMPDHIHIFFGMKPICNISDLVKDIKLASIDFINKNKFINNKFNWQDGYGAFSYSHSHVDSVYKYVSNQKAHHKVESFKDEYIKLLKLFEIQFDEKYLFDWI